MGASAERMLTVRGQLCGHIDNLADNLGVLSPAQLARKVDDIRVIARGHGFVVIAELASGLDKALAGSLSVAFARPFLDAMRDVLRCERADSLVAQAFLASINQRLYG